MYSFVLLFQKVHKRFLSFEEMSFFPHKWRFTQQRLWGKR